MFVELFEETPGTVSLVFLLTKLRNGDVQVEVIRDVNDPRLRSKEPFAAIRVDHFRLERAMQEGLSEYSGEEVDSYIDGEGEVLILKPRVYNRLLAGTTNDFFDALAEVNGDAVLTNYDDEEGEWRW